MAAYFDGLAEDGPPPDAAGWVRLRCSCGAPLAYRIARGPRPFAREVLVHGEGEAKYETLTSAEERLLRALLAPPSRFDRWLDRVHAYESGAMT